MKRLAFKLFLSIAGLLVALILGEIVVRTVKPQVTAKSIVFAYDFHCFVPGTFYAYALKPNTNCRLVSNDHAFPPVTITTNSMGMRNPEVLMPKPPGTLRVLIIGDSYVTGWGVENKDAYPRVIEKLLQAKNPDTHIEVINAGLPGSGPNYYYFFMKNLAEKLQPDIVVVGFYMLNDITDNVYYTRWITKDSHGLPLTIKHDYARIDTTGNIAPSGLPRRLFIPILNDSHLFALIFDAIAQYKASPEKQNPLNPQSCFYKPNCHLVDEAKRKTKLLFSGIQEAAKTAHAETLVVFFPSQLQIDRYARIIYYIKVPLLPSDKERPYAEFEQYFQQHNIDYLDIRPAMQKYTLNELFFASDDHWTAFGSQVAAEATA